MLDARMGWCAGCLPSVLQPASSQIFSLLTFPIRLPPLAALPAGLTELDLSSNALAHLPRALHAAAALQSLGLSHNSQLAVTEAEADSCLLALPSLQQVQLAGTDTAEEVAARLADGLAARQRQRVQQLPSMP